MEKLPDPPARENPDDEEKPLAPLVPQASLTSSPEVLTTASSSGGTSSVAEGGNHERRSYPSPESEANQRARKRQKQLSVAHAAQISKSQQDIAAIKQRLASPVAPWMKQEHTVRQNCLEMQQRVDFLKRKLAEHSHWMQRISSLMESAPLFDFAVGMGAEKKQQQDRDQYQQLQHQHPRTDQNKQQGGGDDSSMPFDRSLLSLQSLDEWRKASENEPLSRFILDERLQVAVRVSRQNGAKLLEDVAMNNPDFHLPLRFESRGWKIATGTLGNTNVTFSCQRRLSAAMINKAKEMAMEVWSSVQRDEVLRTFVPMCLDSVIAYEGTDYSLSRRIVQFAPNNTQQAAATVESMCAYHDDDGQENTWQISMEAVHDHYLCTFAADVSGDFTVPNASAPIKLDLGIQMSKLNMHNKFVMAARVIKTDQSVDVELAGSARFELPQSRDPAFDLLQYFVSLLPVYEDLHLAQYGTG